MKQISSPKKQNGWLMPVAAFIIVAMGLLVTAMTRIGSQTSLAVVQEQLSLQAFYVAESGGQLAMSRLSYPVVDPAVAVAQCASLDGDPSRTVNAPGMKSCLLSYTCSQPEPGFFKIISTGECGQNSLYAKRSIEVGSQLY